MTDQTPSPDAVLEERLRALLAERASSLGGPPPALPEVDRAAELPTTTVVALAPHRRWGLVAATIVAVLAMGATVAVAVRGGDDGSSREHVVTTDPADPLTGLPDGYDPATAAAVFRIDDETDPSEVARRYLTYRLISPTETTKHVLAGLDVEAARAVGPVVPVTWSHRDGRAGGGTVFVRGGAKGSDVVASTTPGVDLGDVAWTDSVISGHVAGRAAGTEGPALVDVLPLGSAYPTWNAGLLVGKAHTGYGSATTGDGAFRVDTDGDGPVLSVRFTGDDGAVDAISEVAFADVESESADVPDFSTMTDEEIQDYMASQPAFVDPRCTAATAELEPFMTHNFPGGDGTAGRSPSDPAMFERTGGATPAEAMTALGRQYGLALDDITVVAPFPTAVRAGARSGDAPVEAFLWLDGDTWRADELSTVTACGINGKGNLTPPGDPAPLTRLSLGAVPGVRSGQLWYRLTDGTAWTLPLDADDFARGNVAVTGEYTEIDRMAFVGRDAAGKVVLVYEAPIMAPG